MARIFGSLLIFLLLIGALVGAVVVGLPLIPLERLAPEIERRASDYLGREVRIDGSLRLTALPSPRLQVSNVSLANWPAGSAQKMASVEELDLIVSLMPLFSRQVHVERLVIKSPTLVLEQRHDSANWEFDIRRPTAGPAAPTPTAANQPDTNANQGMSLGEVSLKSIDIIGGSASFSTNDGAVYALSDIRLAAQMEGLDKPAVTEIAANWRDHALGFSGRLATLGELLDGSAFTIDGQVRLDQHQVGANGTISLSGSPRLTGMNVSASGPSLHDLLEIFAVDVPIGPQVLSDYEATAIIDYADQRADLQQLNANVGDLSISGDFLTSLIGGFFAQSRAPVQLRVGSVDRWIQALPNPPLASNPQLLGVLDLSGAIAVSTESFEVLDASIQLGDVTAQGTAAVNFGPYVDGFQLQTVGPARARVGDLNSWLQYLSRGAVPNDPQLFGVLNVSGDIAATPQSAMFANGELKLSDLTLNGGAQVRFGNGGVQYQSAGPLSLRISNTNRWLDLIPNRPLPQSQALFGPLNLRGELRGTLSDIETTNVQFRLGDIQGNGSLAASFGAQGVRAQSRGPVRLSGPSVDLIAKTWGVNLPRVSPNAYGTFSAQSELSFDGQRLVLSNLSGQIDQTQLAGRATLDIGAAPLAFDVALSAGTIDTTPYFALGKADPAKRKAIAQVDPNAPWGAMPLNFGFLEALQGRASLQVQGITTGFIDLGQTVANVDWQNQALTANVQGTQLYGGQADGRVGLSNRGDVAGLAANVNLSGVDAGRVLADLLGVDQLQGVTSLNIQAATQGQTLQSWMNGMNGRFTASLDPLALLGLDLAQSLENLRGGSFDVVQGTNARTQFDRVGLSGNISNGQAQIDDLSADLGDIDVSGKGLINLALQRLDYRFELLYGGEVPIPLIVRGPWTRPAVRIDSDRVMQYALENPQAFLDLLPAEWNLQGLLPEGFSLVNIEQRANEQINQLAAQAAQQAQAEAERLAQQAAAAAQAEADRIAQQMADQATAFAQQQAANLANQLGGEAGQQVQNLVNQGIDQLGQSQIGSQLQDQATQAAQDALGNFLGNILGN